MSAFNEGLMTGASLGQGAYRQRQARQVGGLMSSGNLAGARDMAYGQGDLATGGALDGRVQQQAEAQRGQQITGALKSNDYEGAMSFASSPEELAQITQYRDSLSEAERATAARNASGLASAIQSVQSLPAEQQLAAAQQAAAQFGIDPATITPQSLTPQALDGLYIQAMGLKDFLEYKREERSSRRPISTPNGIIWPEGTTAADMGAPQSLGSSLPPGWTPVNPNQPAPGQPVRATSEMSQPSRVSFQDTGQARSAIQQIVPGVRFTSGTRSESENQRVGGVPTSNHRRGKAWDLVPPAGMSMAQLAQKMRSEGFRALDEGDHVHVSW